MLQDVNFSNLIGGIAYLIVVGVLATLALVQGNHDAILALIAIISPTTGAAAAVTFLRPRVVANPGPGSTPPAS